MNEERASKVRGLTPRQARFVTLYTKYGNASRAAREAGYSPKSVDVFVAGLLKKKPIQDALQAERAKLEAKLEMTRDQYIARMVQLFTADPRSLVEYKRGCCRHCWGVNYAYQWTDAELQEAQAKAIIEDMPAPDASGGTGYNRNRKPNPDCPECGGEGCGRVIIRDSSEISADARILLAGYKRTKDGEEVLMHSQQRAGETLGKIMGWLDERPTVQIDVAVGSREKLASAIARIEAKKG